MTFQNRQLLSRLQHDLAELYDAPYPDVAFFTDDANMRQLISLHFDVELPLDWPTSPPRIKSSMNGIQHPNLYSSFICCDILRNDSYREDGYTGGYSPAMTLRGLFLQFLTFFSSTKVEQNYGSAIDIGDFIVAKYYREKDVAQRVADFASPGNRRYCNNCCEAYDCFRPSNLEPSSKIEQEWASNPSPETSVTHETKGKGYPDSICIHMLEYHNPKWAAFPHYLPPAQRSMTTAVDESSPLLVHPATCVLDNLPDDIFFTLAAFLPSETVLVFSEAYPRFRAIVESAHELLRRELHSILGIGVAWDPRQHTLASDFDWLSEEAFKKFGVRRSIQKRAFRYFIPLAFSRPHFLRAQDKIWSVLLVVYREMQQADCASLQRTQGVALSRQSEVLNVSPSELLSVIYRMMKNIVVALMKSCDNVLTTRNDFIAQPGARVKARVPDLGEFIVLVTLALVFGKGDVAWSILNGPFLEEAIVRNARWVLRDHPELEVMEEGRSDHRLNTTFNHSKISLRLMMFQVAFLTIFVEAYSSDLGRLDDNCGFAEKEILERMIKAIKDIYKVGDWPTFFEKVQYVRGKSFDLEKLSQLLRDALRVSAERGYHQTATARNLNNARNSRN
ncbi:hypothetical protein DFS33DRAFT_1375331 [Desarmillaria ectypa]|nr:hypothetical protein DFS33DRAFT_1375331 [Desarmillaria ectypa]